MTEQARREDWLRLSGTAGANKLMEAELVRLVKRSPFLVRVPRARRDRDVALLHPFVPEIAWVAACHHRTSSRVGWDLASSPADRLEPLHEDLVGLLSEDERLDVGREIGISVDVGPSRDFQAGPLQLRGVVKNAFIEAWRRRGVTARVDGDHPDLVLTVRRTGPDDERRTTVGIDLGGGPRHVRGHRAATVTAPLRDTLAAQLVLLSRWDPRTEVLVDPMAGGGTIAIEAAALARGSAVRQPTEIGALGILPAFAGLPTEAPPLFADTVPRILACDVDPDLIGPLIGNLRAAGLTGPEHARSIVVKRADVRRLDPRFVAESLPRRPSSATGVFAFNPPYGHRLSEGEDDRQLLQLYRDTAGALGRFHGWRVAVFVAHPGFRAAFGLRPKVNKPATNSTLRGAFLCYDVEPAGTERRGRNFGRRDRR